MSVGLNTSSGPPIQNGKPVFDLSKLMQSPAFDTGLGMMAAAGPSRMPVGLGQAMANGAMMGIGLQRNAMQNQMAQLNLQQQLAAAKVFGGMARNGGQPSPMSPPTNPGPAPAINPVSSLALGARINPNLNVGGQPVNMGGVGPTVANAIRAQQMNAQATQPTAPSVGANVPQPTTPAPQPADPQLTGEQPSQYEQLMGLSNNLFRHGAWQAGMQYYQMAQKYRPIWSTSPVQMRGPDGQLHNYILANNGQRRELDEGVKPNWHFVNEGGKMVAVDQNTMPNGQEFPIGLSPAQAAQEGLNPDGTPTEYSENLARLVATYREPPLTGYALSRPSGQVVMSLAKRYNPNYDASRAEAKYKAVSSFMSGKHGDQVRSANVSVQHLGVLGGLVNALANNDIRAFNQAKNFLGYHAGFTGMTNFNAAKKIVGDEISKFIVGSGNAQSDREALEKSLNAANSPQQLEGVVNTYENLMAGQLDGLRRQFENSTMLPASVFNGLLSPHTVEVMDQHDQQQSTLTGAEPDHYGDLTQYPSQTYNGTTYYQVAPGKWWKP